jgi:diphosphomevalonate decarboxylase
MSSNLGSAVANPNIAFIKYWGNNNDNLRIPSNSSISMNLAGLETNTSVKFQSDLASDQLLLNGQDAETSATKRVSSFLDIVREMAGIQERAAVESTNNFPMGSGIASSASAFAALALAASQAAGLSLNEKQLTILARKGSGSASRSIPQGFVEWHAGDQDRNSYAESFAPANHWDLIDCIAVVDEDHKDTGSSAGHTTAGTSPYQAARVKGSLDRISIIKKAILEKDFESFAKIVEYDSLLMHGVMLTSRPSLLYWSAASVRVLKACKKLSNEGISLATTMDAGPNVHVICPAEEKDDLVEQLEHIPGVKHVLVARVGGAARIATK